jgi:hypothetical protein
VQVFGATFLSHGISNAFLVTQNGLGYILVDFFANSSGHVGCRMARGRCYDHNFLRFSTIFGKKLAFFSKTNVMIKILHF